MGKKQFFGWLVIAGAAAIVASMRSPISSPEDDYTTEPQPTSADGGSVVLLAQLPARQPMTAPRGLLFDVPEPAAAPERLPPVIPPSLSAPPMPYRIAGHVVNDGQAHVVLMKGDQVLTVKTGDVLDGGYRVQSVEGSRVTLVYIPLGMTQYLEVASNLFPTTQATSVVARRGLAEEQKIAISGPAKLRWQGPERVYPGTPFDVALKLISAQPVRSSPLELTYDAKVLEPVAVRAGAFFADGQFNYRVNSNGSIFISASGAGIVSEEVDLLVITFKAIQRAGSADMKLSTVSLRSAAGEVAYERPAVFRTTIVPLHLLSP